MSSVVRRLLAGLLLFVLLVTVLGRVGIGLLPLFDHSTVRYGHFLVDHFEELNS